MLPAIPFFFEETLVVDDKSSNGLVADELALNDLTHDQLKYKWVFTIDISCEPGKASAIENSLHQEDWIDWKESMFARQPAHRSIFVFFLASYKHTCFVRNWKLSCLNITIESDYWQSIFTYILLKFIWKRECSLLD